ncbi:MAG TPA: hypothetical protein VG714_03405 [Acidobacteriaceae bacterium]|nr:hypothetical protein [Acidobacteriaceae bacterium]
MLLRIILAVLWMGLPLAAQTVQPIITEYKAKADGKFAVTNNTLAPMVVVLEPKSFSITPDGKGIFRALDPQIHVELSTRSVTLRPGETSYVFYKATSDHLPAWFTVYATFSAAHHGPGLDVRIMLPHTVYLYQRQPIEQDDVQVDSVLYSPGSRKLVCTVSNAGASLARVQMVEARGGRESEDAAGFPFLPGAKRRIEIDWNKDSPPTELSLRFEHFTIKRPVTAGDQ